MWLVFAFSGPVLWAASTHIDKYLVDRYFQNADTAVLMVFTALIGVAMLPFIAFFKPQALMLDWVSIGVMMASGILFMGAMLFYLRAIQSNEASVVAPLFQGSTIFTLVLGYLLLGETPTPMKLGGVALIVSGALLLTLGPSRHARMSTRLIALMLGCTFVVALASVSFKYFAVRDDFWSTTFWMYVGEALFGAGILALPRYRRQFAELLKTNTRALLAVNGANELINLGGGLGVRFASLLAPVAVVSAISSTTTLFVFAFGVLFSWLAPALGREDMSAANLMRKGAAAAVVAAGVLLTAL
jgi:drug/metabolite transporter (DMT)-like permease